MGLFLAHCRDLDDGSIGCLVHQYGIDCGRLDTRNLGLYRRLTFTWGAYLRNLPMWIVTGAVLAAILGRLASDPYKTKSPPANPPETR